LSALLCHTTGHAGPHPAVRRVELTRSGELGKSERGKVSVRQSDFQCCRYSRGATDHRSCPRCARSPAPAMPRLRKLATPSGSPFPLFPDHRPDLRSSHRLRRKAATEEYQPAGYRWVVVPGASLSLHVHHVVKRTCTSKLSCMLGTPKRKGKSRSASPFTGENLVVRRGISLGRVRAQ
jgi:hypothetical protein